MVNCTAVEHLDMIDMVYGDYMDGIGSLIYIEGSDLTGSEPNEMAIRAFGAIFVVCR